MVASVFVRVLVRLLVWDVCVCYCGASLPGCLLDRLFFVLLGSLAYFFLYVQLCVRVSVFMRICFRVCLGFVSCL